MSSIGGKTEERDQSCGDLGRVDDLTGFGLQDVDVALGSAGDDVIAKYREDGGGSGLFILRARDIVTQWSSWQNAFDRDAIGYVDQVRSVFEEGRDKQVMVVWVQFRSVNRRFELDCPNPLLSLEVPQTRTTVLRCR